jgi:carbon-monoxide dehydrogenase medium subunit
MLRRDLHVHRAHDIEEALALLEEYGDDATLYAGGTELVLVLKLGLSSVQHLVDVRPIPELSGLDLVPDGEIGAGTVLRIGAATTHWAVQGAPAVRAGWPALAAMERTVGNLRVQTTGTLGGNLCFADPQSDPATFLVAGEAAVVCASKGRRRTLSVADFLRDAYSSALHDGEELLESILLPLPSEGTSVAHRKFALGERPDVTCCAVVTTVDGRVDRARVVLGSVTGVPAPLAVSAELVGLSAEEAAAAAGEIAQAGVAEIADRMLGDKQTPYARALARSLMGSVLVEAITAGVQPSATSFPGG